MKIQDVAKKAQVGVGTVSRVINDSGYVSETTREKVLQAIEDLNYTPNELARNLLHKKTNTIAVIIPDISNPFYSSMVNEIEKNLRTLGYKTLLCNTAGEKTNEQAYLDMLQRNMVDGVLTGTHTLEGSRYRNLKGPVVAFDTPRFSEQIPVITAEHGTGGALAAKELLEAGCRHVVQFRDNVDSKFPYFKRHEEFERVIRAAGAVCENYTTDWNRFENDYYVRLVEDCLKQYPDVDGMFGTDLLAMHFMKLILASGRRVPEDMKIVAYDGTYVTDIMYPTVTTVEQPVAGLAKAGVELLMKLINGEKPDTAEVSLPVTLRRRMSTRNDNRKDHGYKNE